MRTQVLDLSQRGLKQVPPIPDHVTELSLAGNRLTDLPCDLPRGLQILDISDNRLAKITPGLPRGLTTLYASRNAIRHIDLLPRRLAALDISANRLITLPESWPSSLRHLDASSNLLDECPASLPDSLSSLDLSHNLISRLPDRLPSNLRKLRADRNECLVSLPPSLPGGLERMSVCDCMLTGLPPALPDSLVSLYVSNNALTRLPSLPPALRILDASCNRIDVVELNGLQQLRTLCLSDNALMTPPSFLAAARRATWMNLGMRSGCHGGRDVDLTKNPFVNRLTAIELDALLGRQAPWDTLFVHLDGAGIKRRLDRVRNSPRYWASV
ncbi:MAG TPA: hypothetical protein VL424_16590 [Pararobbsia sp.]|nr:hypothetical protein [Pararobbsia sp.]